MTAASYNQRAPRRTVDASRQELPVSITKTEPMSEETYRQFALGDPQGQWELYRGQLREKPGMSVEHGGVIGQLARVLSTISLTETSIGSEPHHARLRRSADTYYVPDIAVIPTPVVQALLEQPGSLDAYPEPLPLVVEIWSPSTGRYDINEKLPDYQQRGDLEIWYVHPYERTLTAWRRRPDGASYRVGLPRRDRASGIAARRGHRSRRALRAVTRVEAVSVSSETPERRSRPRPVRPRRWRRSRASPRRESAAPPSPLRPAGRHPETSARSGKTRRRERPRSRAAAPAASHPVPSTTTPAARSSS